MPLKYVILLFLLQGFLAAGAQKVVHTVGTYTFAVYYDLESTKGENKDSIFKLFLGNCGLKEFPTEILAFKNLDLLSFTDETIDDIYRSDSLRLTQKDRDYVREAFKEMYAPGGWLSAFKFDFPRRNRNTFKSIPEEIKALAHLQELYLNKGQLSKKTVKKLEKLLPDCTVFVAEF